MQVNVSVKAGLPEALGSWLRTGGSSGTEPVPRAPLCVGRVVPAPTASGHPVLQSEPQGLWLRAFAPLPVEHYQFVLPQLYVPR